MLTGQHNTIITNQSINQSVSGSIKSVNAQLAVRPMWAACVCDYDGEICKDVYIFVQLYLHVLGL